MKTSDLNDLSIGDPIVHKKYGIGRYGGLQGLTMNGSNDFVVVEYPGRSQVRLFCICVPIASLDMLSLLYIKNDGQEKESVPLCTVVDIEEDVFYNFFKEFNPQLSILDICSLSLPEENYVNIQPSCPHLGDIGKGGKQSQNRQHLINEIKILRNHFLDNKILNIFWNKAIERDIYFKIVRLFFSGIDNKDNLFFLYTKNYYYRLYIPVDLLYEINFKNNEKLINEIIPTPKFIIKTPPPILIPSNTKHITEIRINARIRIVQKEFKEDLIKYWEGKCAVTGFGVRKLLKASHIKPWKDCKDSNEFERRDIFNGLLLAPGLDNAFDKGYISFSEKDGSMLISDELSKNNKELLGIVAEYPKLSKIDEKHKIYLRYHLSHVYENWKNLVL